MAASGETGDPAAFQAFERRIHDRLAPTYHEAFSPVTAQAIGPLLDAVRLAAGQRLLDVATGPGSVAAAAALRGAVATGLDISPGMVALARRLHPGIRFAQAEAEDLPFEAASFDAVVSNFGIGHFARPERALAGFARVLAPGGRVALAWWDRPERSRINGLFFEAVAALGIRPPAALPPGPSAFTFSDDDRLQGVLAAAGFGDIGIAAHEGTHALPGGIDALWDLARGSFARLGAIIAELSPDEQTALKAEVAARAAPYWNAGGLTIPIAFKIAAGTLP